MPYDQVRSFEEWVITWFDHPATTQREFGTFWETSITYRASQRRELLYMSQAFENAERVFAPYSNDQIGFALRAIVSVTIGRRFRGLLNYQIPRVERERCFASLSVLYEQLFARRCANYLSHKQTDRDNPDHNALNDTCYLWWLIVPVIGISQTYIDKRFLDVMLKALTLDSEPCQESALNGLTKFTKFNTDNRRPEIEEHIAAFLAAHPHISPELREYAEKASYGDVL